MKHEELFSFIKTARYRFLIRQTAEGLMECLFIISAVLISGGVFEFFLIRYFPAKAVILLRWILIIGSAGIAGFSFARISLKLAGYLFSDDKLALFIQRKEPMLKDDLINSLQLLRDSKFNDFVSGDLIHALADRTGEKLKKINISKTIDYRALKPAARMSSFVIFILLLFCLLPPHIVPTAWQRIFHPGIYTYNKQLDLTSREIPQLGEIRLVQIYPDYTGYQPQVMSGNEIEILRFSRLKLFASANKILKEAVVLRRPGSSVPARIINLSGPVAHSDIESEIRVENDYTFWVVVKDENNNENEAPLHYSVRAMPDLPPQAVILAPAFDIMAADRAQVKLVCETRDDFGVGKLVLAWRKSGHEFRQNIENYNPAAAHQVTEYQWDLARLSLSRGDKINFWIEAWDNDNISGPKKGVSKSYEIEIISWQEQLDKMGLPAPKNDNFDEIMRQSEALVDSGDNLLKQLSQLSRLDPAALAALQNELNQIASLLDQMRQAIASMTQNVPEELIEKDKLQNMNFSKIADLYNQIRQKIAEGKFAEAQELARQLNQQLSQLLETMRNASQNSRLMQAYQRSREVKKQMSELDSLIENETKIAGNTDDLDRERIKQMLAVQEDLLKQLAKEQKAIYQALLDCGQTTRDKISRTTGAQVFNRQYVQTASDMSTAVKMFESEELETIMPVLQNCESDLTRQVELCKGFLNEEMAQVVNLTVSLNQQGIKDDERKKIESENQQHIQMSSDIGSVHDQFIGLASREQKIIDALKNQEENTAGVFSRNRKQDLSNLQNQQSGNRDRTSQLKSKLDILNTLTNGTCSEACESLGQAAGSMQTAESSLSSGRTGTALENELSSLEKLNSAKQGLTQASEKLSAAENIAGQQMSNFIIPQKRASGGGTSGSQEGYVKIPSASDYQPSKEYRQEILDAIKEKFPPAYREMLEQYYRRLTE